MDDRLGYLAISKICVGPNHRLRIAQHTHVTAVQCCEWIDTSNKRGSTCKTSGAVRQNVFTSKWIRRLGHRWDCSFGIKLAPEKRQLLKSKTFRSYYFHSRSRIGTTETHYSPILLLQQNGVVSLCPSFPKFAEPLCHLDFRAVLNTAKITSGNNRHFFQIVSSRAQLDGISNLILACWSRLVRIPVLRSRKNVFLRCKKFAVSKPKAE